MKRMISLILTPVLALALCCAPTFAVAPPLEAETAESVDADAPRYGVYMAGCTIDMENNTYADLVFSMTEKNGTTCFVGLESISFRTTNPNGSHWRIEEYHYTINESSFFLYVTVKDEEGNTLSSNIPAYLTYCLLPRQVAFYSLPAQDGSGIVLTPESVLISAVWGDEDISCEFVDYVP